MPLSSPVKIHYLPKSNWAPVHNICSVVVAPLESRRATSCSYNSSHPVWHALYECLQDIHGDSSSFLLQSFHELSNGFWPRLTSPHTANQFVPKMFYRVKVEALGGPVQSVNIVVGVPLHKSECESPAKKRRGIGNITDKMKASRRKGEEFVTTTGRLVERKQSGPDGGYQHNELIRKAKKTLLAFEVKPIRAQEVRYVKAWWQGDGLLSDDFKLCKGSEVALPTISTYDEKIPIKKQKLEDLAKIVHYVPDDCKDFSHVIVAFFGCGRRNSIDRRRSNASAPPYRRADLAGAVSGFRTAGEMRCKTKDGRTGVGVEKKEQKQGDLAHLVYRHGWARSTQRGDDETGWPADAACFTAPTPSGDWTAGVRACLAAAGGVCSASERSIVAGRLRRRPPRSLARTTDAALPIEQRRNKGRGKREIHEKARRPAASSSTIPTCKDPGVVRHGIEPGSTWWEASSLTSQPPRPLP
ncbi:hypothetical protein PR048_011772 [Dryococelus australis]|uniref:Uncharacterized protein n=1 Tax=Dryococelus australis TaxID=614101 RepID=A0ABQ9HMK1_9NEOP|nr:hypothetical protein PR048_011772 [Dryococelus australis]